jgi:hypothetical protein
VLTTITTTTTTTTTTVVSTSTSTIVSTSTSTAATQMMDSLDIIGTVILILLLLTNELISSYRRGNISLVGNNLNIAIVPLLIMFIAIVFTEITSTL